MHPTRSKTLVAAATLALVAGCGGGDGVGSGGTGNVRVALTDAPACGYDEVNVTIEKIRIHQSAAAGDNDAGWSEVVLSPARRVDLLTLTNGVLDELGQIALPAGIYTQLRLVLGSNGGATPLANSVLPSGGSETALDTPSAQQSGLKLNVNLSVAPNKLADFVLDFDACKSVVRRGNSGRYNLKPVLAVIPRLSDAGQRIVGHVDPSIAATTSVSAQNGPTPKSTRPDLVTGQFVLYPVAPGDYDLVVSAGGRVTAVMTGVPVTLGAYTFASPASAPFNPPASTTRSASGTVTVAGSSADTDATVAARQTLDAAGPTIEVASQPVDADTGAYSFALPAGAPQRTAYVAGATALTFSPAASAAGKYTLVASVPGRADKTAPIDIGAAAAVSAFTFP